MSSEVSLYKCTHTHTQTHSTQVIPNIHMLSQRWIQDLKKGVAQHTVFFSHRRQPGKSRKSPKKADERGGGGGGEIRHFFSERHPASRFAQVQKRRGGGGNPTHFFICLGFKRGGANVKTKNKQKGGMGRVCPPPPLNPPLC